MPLRLPLMTCLCYLLRHETRERQHESRFPVLELRNAVQLACVQAVHHIAHCVIAITDASL